jgi:hypothetical protein
MPDIGYYEAVEHCETWLSQREAYMQRHGIAELEMAEE